jgi:beta-lactamase superfamily II metal-dependent hydrolase
MSATIIRAWTAWALLGACAGLLACGGSGGGVCGTGSWSSGALEIHHFAVGQADATLLVGPSGRSLLVDVGESSASAEAAGAGLHAGADQIGQKVEAVLGCRRLDAVLSTHFHLDHVGAVGAGGLWHLIAVQGFDVGTIWHRDVDHFSGVQGSVLAGWRQLLEHPPEGFGPRVIAPGADQLDLGPGIDLSVIAVDGAAVLKPGVLDGAPVPPNENDYSVAFTLRFGQFDYLLGGDLSGQFWQGADSTYHDIETRVARGLRDVDVYRVNHHGSDHSSNPTWLGQIDPEVAIISVGPGNSYGHPAAGTLRRLAATGAVYATSRGDTPAALLALGLPRIPGDVVVRSLDGQHYTVAGDAYVATDPVRIDRDGDGYVREIDPDDGDAGVVPPPWGGCDRAVEACGPAPRP